MSLASLAFAFAITASPAPAQTPINATLTAMKTAPADQTALANIWRREIAAEIADSADLHARIPSVPLLSSVVILSTSFPTKAGLLTISSIDSRNRDLCRPDPEAPKEENSAAIVCPLKITIQKSGEPQRLIYSGDVCFARTYDDAGALSAAATTSVQFNPATSVLRITGRFNGQDPCANSPLKLDEALQ